MKQRIITGGLLLAILIPLSIWGSALSHLVIFIVIAALGLCEVGAMFAAKADAKGEGNAKVGAKVNGFGISIGTAYLCALWFGTLAMGIFALVAGLALLFLGEMRRGVQDDTLARLSSTIFAVCYIYLGWGFLLLIHQGWGADAISGDARLLLLYLILVVKITDIGAYFTGSWIGKHKAFPKLSPKKTWEGCIGGVVWALALSFIYMFANDFEVSGISFSPLHVVVLSVCLSITGIFGDLAESLLKRAGKVKDSGRAVKGMGGSLDVIDSILFTAPVMYAYVMYVMAA